MQKTIPYEKIENLRLHARLAALLAEAKVIQNALYVKVEDEAPETAPETAAPAPKAEAKKKAATKTKEDAAPVVTDEFAALAFDEAPAVTEEKPADKKTILKACQDYAQKNGMPKFAEILKKFSATKLQEVKEADLQSLYKAVI